MNNKIPENKWLEVRSQMKAWWDRLSDDEIEQAFNRVDQFVKLLHEKYGYTYEQAEKELQWWLNSATLTPESDQGSD